jgi:hypothetical protein
MRRCLHFQELWWHVFPKKHGRAQEQRSASRNHTLQIFALGAAFRIRGIGWRLPSLLVFEF